MVCVALLARNHNSLGLGLRLLLLLLAPVRNGIMMMKAKGGRGDKSGGLGARATNMLSAALDGWTATPRAHCAAPMLRPTLLRRHLLLLLSWRALQLAFCCGATLISGRKQRELAVAA